MTRRSWSGPAPCFLIIAGLATALAPPRMAAAGQDAAATPFVQTMALFVQPMALNFVAEPSAEQTSDEKEQTVGEKKETGNKKGDRLKPRWRSASLEYGKKVRLDFRSRMRGEVRASDAAITKEALDELDIPRRRIGVDGAILSAVAFKVDRELDRTDPWRDAYVDITQLREVQFRYGQFKMPFSLDENTGSLDLDFAYDRPRDAAGSKPRQGWMVHGDTMDRFVGYEYGVFRTDGSNAIVHTSEQRVNAGETTVWRGWSEPLRGLNFPLADVHVGYARTSGELPEGISGIKGRTVLGADFYKPEFFVFGRRERRGFEFEWQPGPASVTMESITLTEERKGKASRTPTCRPIRSRDST
jgi:hypothetical protein